MRDQTLRKFWQLVERQHGVVTRQQLLAYGFTSGEIRSRLGDGRLHPLWRGVYAVGRPDVTREGRWLAAVLACGDGAVLSHGSAAALWKLGEYEQGDIEVSVPADAFRRRPGVRIRRCTHLTAADLAVRRRIPLTSPIRTVIDLGSRLNAVGVEAVVNEAANRDLFTPDELRSELAARAGQRGVAKMAKVLDRRTFRLTRSELERLFLPLARRAGLPTPVTRAWLNGFEVDFYFPRIRLVVETDSLRFHRTPAQQARDRLRDQAHMTAGLTPLRFTHAQIRYEPRDVERTLRKVAARLTHV